ncbi:MAG: biotin/lipoyl-binding protein, partial [Alphaproteobacteria bacterium]|nr:biotin/lipoyl-binding protein [Alphaproteobacteria bacterium]
MAVRKILIANRGEIALRIARAARSMGLGTVMVHSEDDAQALHVRLADEAAALPGTGPRAYLDAQAILSAARAHDCDAIHPGYGFLSESAAFGQACAEAGITFIGPSPETLALFGDKVRARGLAVRLGVPLMPGTDGTTSLAEAQAFFDAQGPGARIIIKAAAGGGGRGMRIVSERSALAEAYERCRSEALSGFGSGEVYVERFLPRARHIEVQILGDGTGAVVHLHERDCSLQRRNQKIVEIAPSPDLDPDIRARLLEAALALAGAARYKGAGTMEFLVGTGEDEGLIAFIEGNARLQVEHTVTEAVTGIDLVRAQIAIAGGATLDGLGLTQDAIPAPRGFAVQARVNMETLEADGSLRPGVGTLSMYLPPSGAGIRVDGYGYPGFSPSARFDSLLAKVIVHSPVPDFPEALALARSALEDFAIAGIDTNIGFLLALMDAREVRDWRVHTRYVDEALPGLVAAAAGRAPRARARLADGTAGTDRARTTLEAAPPGTKAIPSPLTGTIVAFDVAEGDAVHAGRQICVLEAMKMEHLVTAPVAGHVRRLAAGPRPPG